MKSSQIAKLLIGLTLTLLETSCACVYFVENAGKHSLSLAPQAMWSTDRGDRAIECRLMDRSEIPHILRNLGTRFVIGTEEAWSKKIASSYASYKNKPVNYVYLNIAVQTANINMADNLFTLEPNELIIEQCDSRLSEVWHCNSNPNPAPDPENKCWFPAIYKGGQISVYIHEISILSKDRTYKEWWWYTNQVLLIPAFVVDVATFPIQFIIIIHNLDKAGIVLKSGSKKHLQC